MTQEFTEDAPLIGIKGYENLGGSLQSLSFYQYSCFLSAKDIFGYEDVVFGID